MFGNRHFFVAVIGLLQGRAFASAGQRFRAHAGTGDVSVLCESAPLLHCDDKGKKIYICHFDEDDQEYETLCVNINGAKNGHLKTHQEDYCGECDDDPLDQDLGPVTYPFLTLLSPSPYTFNPLNSQLCVEISNALFSAESVTLVVNSQITSPTINEALVCIDPFSFQDGVNIIEITALVLSGTDTYDVSLKREIHAGSESVDVFLLDELGNLFIAETVVEVQLSDNELVKSNHITNSSSGSVTITDLPRRTIIIRAEGPQGELGWGAIVAGMSASLNIVLKGFNNPSSVDNKDFSAGLNGWEIAAGVDVSLVPHNEDVGPDTVVGRRRLQLNDDLRIGTGGVEGESSASHTFTSSEGACAFRVRYRFVTSEVPGDFFGTEYNDYFSVAIRAQNSGEEKLEANTMNGLGLAAFDYSSGSTSWREVVLALDHSFIFGNPDTVQVDMTVANVADCSYDSQVYIDFVEEIFVDPDNDNEPCACAQCQAWFDEEIKDTAWIDALPTCPCTVVEGTLICTVRPSGSNILTGELNGVNWSTDKAMNPCADFGYHPGASSCIRAAGPGNTAQQCCYGAPNAAGASPILEHGTPGAGTPDRNFPDHISGDVDTYDLCCTECPDLCELYTGKTDGTQGARSDPTHSSTGCAGL